MLAHVRGSHFGCMSTRQQVGSVHVLLRLVQEPTGRLAVDGLAFSSAAVRVALKQTRPCPLGALLQQLHRFLCELLDHPTSCGFSSSGPASLC